MEILRASLAHRATAELLLTEYYQAIGVEKRDPPEVITAYLSEDDSALWIAFVEGEPAGCVVLRPLGSTRQAAECKRLYVRPCFRGRGIAEALLATMEEYALSSSLQWVYLDSKDDLTAALRLYMRRGYQACMRYNDNPQATVFLRKELRTSSATQAFI